MAAYEYLLVINIVTQEDPDWNGTWYIRKPGVMAEAEAEEKRRAPSSLSSMSSGPTGGSWLRRRRWTQ